MLTMHADGEQQQQQQHTHEDVCDGVGVPLVRAEGVHVF